MSASQEIDAPRHWLREWVKSAVIRCVSGALVGGAAQARYVARLGMPAERIAIGYNVVDNDFFSAGAEAARKDGDLRRRLGLPQRFFVSISRFIEKKNLPVLIEAYRRYRAAAADPWELVLVGDGPARKSIEAAAGEGVHIRPFARYPELPGLYALAGAFVLASTSEQWGLVVNEAMASGCPVIVSDRAGAVAELVDDGVTGIVTQPDVDALERALHRMASADRDAMTAAAHKRIASYGPARFAAGMHAAAAHPPRRTGVRAPLQHAFVRALILRGGA